MNPQQMQMLYAQMAQRAIAPQMARMQAARRPVPQQPAMAQQIAQPRAVAQQPRQWGFGTGTRGPSPTPEAVAAQREEERRLAAEKAAMRQQGVGRQQPQTAKALNAASSPSQWSLMDYMGGQMIPVSGPTQDWNGPKGTSRNFWQWGQGEDGKAEVWWKPEFAPKELRYSYEKIRPDNWEEILNKNAPVVDRSSMTPADLAAEGSHAAAGSPRGVYSGTPNPWVSMNTATGRFETPIQPFGYTDQAGRYIGPYQQGYGNYVAPMLEPQSVNATPYTT